MENTMLLELDETKITELCYKMENGKTLVLKMKDGILDDADVLHPTKNEVVWSYFANVILNPKNYTREELREALEAIKTLNTDALSDVAKNPIDFAAEYMKRTGKPLPTKKEADSDYQELVKKQEPIHENF